MDRTPRQPDQRDRLEAALREQHRRAREFDKYLNKDLAGYFYEEPSKAAQDLLFLVPRQMDAWQYRAVARFGVDLEKREKRENFNIETFEDAVEVIRLANHYYTCDRAMEHWATLEDSGLSGKQLAMKVCEAFLEAWRGRPGLATSGIEVIEAGLPDPLKKLALSTYLTGYLAIHTSLRINRRLKHGIDELREEGESRFARLLKELPAEALTAYRAREAGWGDLMDVRTEAVRPLEKSDFEKSEIHELAAFAERETLLKRVREAGLTPREHELFGLVTGDTERFFRNGKLDHGEAARELGVAVGTIKSLWSRIRKTLNAA